MEVFSSFRATLPHGSLRKLLSWLALPPAYYHMASIISASNPCKNPRNTSRAAADIAGVNCDGAEISCRVCLMREWVGVRLLPFFALCLSLGGNCRLYRTAAASASPVKSLINCKSCSPSFIQGAFFFMLLLPSFLCLGYSSLSSLYTVNTFLRLLHSP